MEEVELPVKQVDIIISEWMGYFLLFEAMLDTVLYARDRYLVPGGLILPDHVSLTVAAIQDRKAKAKRFDYWQDVYGFNMECIKSVSQAEPFVDVVDKMLVVSDACKFFEIDLYTVQLKDLDFVGKYEIKAKQDDTVDALVCWFDAVFSKLECPIVLSTSVYAPETHWCQTVFYLRTPIKVRKGEVINGIIAVRKAKDNFRNLDIAITYNHKDRGNTSYKQLYKIT